MYIVKYDSFGNALWAKTLNGGGDDQNAVAVAKNGDIYIAGDFEASQLIVGFDTLISTCAECPFIAKLSHPSLTGIAESDFGNNQIQISPNPFTSTTTITFSEEQKNTTIKVYDILGQCVLQSPPLRGGREGLLDMSGYAKGIYFVQITSLSPLGRVGEGLVVNRKIVVQ
jgi:hypothetical protein